MYFKVYLRNTNTNMLYSMQIIKFNVLGRAHCSAQILLNNDAFCGGIVTNRTANDWKESRACELSCFPATNWSFLIIVCFLFLGYKIVNSCIASNTGFSKSHSKENRTQKSKSKIDSSWWYIDSIARIEQDSIWFRNGFNMQIFLNICSNKNKESVPSNIAFGTCCQYKGRFKK